MGHDSEFCSTDGIVSDDYGKSQGAKKAGIALSATAVFALLPLLRPQSIDIDFSHINRCWKWRILFQQKLTYLISVWGAVFSNPSTSKAWCNWALETGWVGACIPVSRAVSNKSRIKISKAFSAASIGDFSMRPS